MSDTYWQYRAIKQAITQYYQALSAALDCIVLGFYLAFLSGMCALEDQW